MELFICIKMDLALNNLQWLICHKTKPKFGVASEIKQATIKMMSDVDAVLIIKIRDFF